MLAIYAIISEIFEIEMCMTLYLWNGPRSNVNNANRKPICDFLYESISIFSRSVAVYEIIMYELCKRSLFDSKCSLSMSRRTTSPSSSLDGSLYDLPFGLDGSLYDLPFGLDGSLYDLPFGEKMRTPFEAVLALSTNEGYEHTCKNTYTYTHTHTRIHTHPHTYTHMLKPICKALLFS